MERKALKILITGSDGFIGKNLVAQFRNRGYEELLLCKRNTGEVVLEKYLEECDFVFHLAGVNRSANPEAFTEGNINFTRKILNKLKDCANLCPVVASSSIQAGANHIYGQSKKAMEDLLFEYAESNKTKAYVYRLPNVYGKWCRPNYNSVVATFCFNIVRDIPLKIDNPQTVLQLVYIDDVVNTFIDGMEGKVITEDNGFCTVPIVDFVKLETVAQKLTSFHESRKTLELPPFENDFDRKLYAVYTSYLPEDEFSYVLDAKSDERGYFCECLKCRDFGQVSISVTKPGIVRGNHWHNTKTEKFMAIQGSGIVRFRPVCGDEVTAYEVHGHTPEIVDVPPGYTHNIENTGQGELIMLIWSSEQFDPQNPDTYWNPVG